MTATRREFTITCLQQDDEGCWTARLTISGGETVTVDRAMGSWRIPPVEAKPARELLPFYAAALQQKVRRLERRAAT